MAQKHLHCLSPSIQTKSSGKNELKRKVAGGILPGANLRVLPTPHTQTADIAILEAQIRECDEILVAQDKNLWSFRQQIRERDEAILALIQLVESGMGGALDQIVVEWRRRLSRS